MPNSFLPRGGANICSSPSRLEQRLATTRRQATESVFANTRRRKRPHAGETHAHASQLNKLNSREKARGRRTPNFFRRRQLNQKQTRVPFDNSINFSFRLSPSLPRPSSLSPSQPHERDTLAANSSNLHTSFARSSALLSPSSYSMSALLPRRPVTTPGKSAVSEDQKIERGSRGREPTEREAPGCRGGSLCAA